MKLNILAAATLLAISISSFGQEKMTLSQAIHTARSQSVLSRQIMRMHNGTLNLTRSDEKGTVFTLVFK